MSYNITRVTGMFSGFDTDQLVKDLMEAENMKVDKAKQDRQYLEWKQEEYRDIINQLRDFEDKYFSYSSADTNLRSSKTFNGYAVNMASENDSRYIEVTSTSSAVTGNYTISNISLAKNARAEGSAISTGNIEGASLTPFPTISNANDNNKITVTLNGASKVIDLGDLTDQDLDSDVDIDDLVSVLQDEVNTEFGNSKITIGKNGDKLTFSTESTNTLKIDYAYNDGYKLFGSTIGTNKVIDNQNDKFEVTYNGSTSSIELTEGTYADADALADEIQNQIDTAFGADNMRVVNSSGKLSLKTIDSTKNATVTNSWDTHDVASGITVDGTTVKDNFDVTIDGETYNVSLDQKTYTKDELVSALRSQIDNSKVAVTVNSSDGTLRFEALSSEKASIGKTNNTGLEAMGLNNSNLSNKVDLSANLTEANFGTTLATGTGDIIKFNVNGESFEFDAANTSMNDIISTVNGNGNANVSMMYDELRDMIIVESKDTGATADVEIADVAGNFMQVLGLNGASADGSDASITINDGNGDQTISRPDNEFTVNGITYDLKDDYTGSVGFRVEGDSDELFDKIKGFVEDYNKIIENVNEKLNEERNYDYDPLTDKQKDALSEKEAELWEEKAKSGILRSDSTLRSLVNNLRDAMYESVDGVALYNIGITTSSNYKDAGKLVIDENKLRQSIEDNTDQIANLFTKADEGISNKIYDILEKNVSIRTNSNGQKGLLLEKAGMSGDRTVNSNILSNKISNYDDMIDEMLEDLARKEDYYYNMFAKMEKALSQMQSQTSFLTGQMG